MYSDYLFFCQILTQFLQQRMLYCIYKSKNITMDPERPQTTSTTITEDLPSAPDNYFIKDIEITLDSPAVCSEYLPTSGLICLGCLDGTTRILSPTKKQIQYSLIKEDKSAVTGIASTPSNSTIKNTIMVCHSGGTLEYWHCTSNQLLFQKKYDTQLYSCEISCNTEWYVVSAENGQMLLGHLDKGNPSMLETGHLGSHGNRVFCIKWHPNDSNLFFSGGWDKSVFMWDVRTKTSVKCIYGYQIGGQSIDIHNNKLLLGSNQNGKHLTIYDLKSQKSTQIPWQHYTSASKKSVRGVNSCFFGKQEGDILALSSRNQLRFIRTDKCLSMFSYPDVDVKGFSMSHWENDKQIVVTWSNGDVQVMAY